MVQLLDKKDAAKWVFHSSILGYSTLTTYLSLCKFRLTRSDGAIAGRGGGNSDEVVEAADAE